MSQSSTSWNGDIGTRYERLAAEYAKLRAQATVLKKGVLEERGKNEKLTEDLKSAENVTRKLRSENESLAFRNEQLLKRVQNVQDELEESHRVASGGKKKEKRKEGPSEREKQLETSLAILEEELRGKLNANERLTNKLEEFSSLNEMLTLQLRELKERIEEMDRNGRGLQSRIPPRKEIENGTSSSPRPSSPSMASLQSLTTLISDSPLWQIAENGRAILSGMSTLLSLLEQRVRIFPYDASLEKLPPHVEQLGVHLGEASKKFAAADEVANRLFEEPADKWKQSSSAILSSIDEAVKYCEEKLPSLLLNMSQEESRCPWSDSALEALNERWRNSLCSLFSSFSSLSPSITSSLDGNTKELTELGKAINAVHVAIKSTQESFSARWLVETRLPVQTKKGKCVGTATRDILLKMLGGSQRVTTKLNGVIKEMEEKNEMERRGKEEERREREEEKEKDEMRSEEEGTVPLVVVDSSPDISLSQRKDSIRSSKSQSPREERREEREREQRRERKLSELSHLRSRVSHLEGEREKMLLDIALMRRKLGGGTAGSDDPSSPSSPQSAAVAAEVERHYRGRLREMAEKSIEDAARGDYYSKECESLVRSARCMQNERRKLEEEIEAMTREKLALFDELRTTQYGYESKLREMSDHVAMLNTEKEEREKEKERNQKNTLSRRLTLFK